MTNPVIPAQAVEAALVEAHSELEWSFEYGGFVCAECGWQETYAHTYAQDAQTSARDEHMAAVLSAAGVLK